MSADRNKIGPAFRVRQGFIEDTAKPVPCFTCGEPVPVARPNIFCSAECEDTSAPIGDADVADDDETITCECEGNCSDTAANHGSEPCPSDATRILTDAEGEPMLHVCAACDPEAECDGKHAAEACGYDCYKFDARNPSGTGE